MLFIIPIITDIHGHRFKTYTLVSGIHENVDMVLGIKNIFELVLKPKEQKLIKVKTSFIDEIEIDEITKAFI